MGAVKIKDCPCCGAPGKLKSVKAYVGVMRGWVGCPACSLYIQWAHNPAEAIAKWNRRQAMGDYISREAAIKRIKELHFGCKDFHVCGGVLLEINALDQLPAADVVELRHGKWERTEGNPYPSCSECGIESLSRADRPYCQFCGAKMDGKSADYAPAKPYDLLYEEGGPDA